MDLLSASYSDEMAALSDILLFLLHRFRSPSTGGMYRPGGYDDKYDYDRYEGRYGSRDDDNGYGRERDYGYKNDDRYSRNGDSYGRDGDRYGRDYEDRYGKDGYRDDDYRGSNSVDQYQDGSTRSSDRNHVDDGQSSNRYLSSCAKND